MRIALVCPELHGHLNPMTTLGAALAARGHHVIVFGTPDAREKTERMGLDYHGIGLEEHAAGTFEHDTKKLAELSGYAALRFTGHLLTQSVRFGLRDLPDAFITRKVQGILVDQVSPAAACVGDVLQLPYVIACNAMAMHQEPGVPPGLTSWPYRTGWLAQVRNRLGNLLLRAAARPLYKLLNAYLRSHGLKPRGQGVNADYGLAQIAQQPDFFDFPRQHLPSHFHYTGPWHQPNRDTHLDFPWERLNDRPLIYASLGTLQNRLFDVFGAIIQGCAHLDVQLVVSLGRAKTSWTGPQAANALVVPFAPQLPLLDRAEVVITHAGLNTVLESLGRGKPMLCLPVTNDQPGVANRVRWLGAGELLSWKRATPGVIRAAVQRLLSEPSYTEAARRCAERVASVDGLELAADIAELALTSGRRVERDQYTRQKTAFK